MNGTCLPGCGCECCTGIGKRTPRPVANRQGKSALDYRVGTFSDFFESTIAALPSTKIDTAEDQTGSAALLGRVLTGQTTPSSRGPEYPLAALSARTTDDFAIALLDAWAIVLDVLTFYQERIANEGYLRTATEFRSILELARLVGYEPKQGVGSTTYLAYGVEKDFTLTIPAGSKAQSVPASGQTPQTFETFEDLPARSAWSSLTPRKARPQMFEPGQTAAGKRVWFQGLATQLQPNDPFVLVFDGVKGEPFRVKRVVPDNPSQTTMVVLQEFAPAPLTNEPGTAIGLAAKEITAAIDAYEEDASPDVAAYVRLKATVQAVWAGLLAKYPDSQATNAVVQKDIDDARQALIEARDRIFPPGVDLNWLEPFLQRAVADFPASDSETVKALWAKHGPRLNDISGIKLAALVDEPNQVLAIGIVRAIEIAVDKARKADADLKAKPDSTKDPESDLLVALRTKLLSLRNLRGDSQSNDPDLDQRLVPLIARIERAEDRLVLDDLFRTSASPANIVAPMELANQLAQDAYERQADLRKKRLTDPTVDEAKDKVLHDLGSNAFYAARSILRDIVTRYLTLELAGVEIDTRIAATATAHFNKLRNNLNPLVSFHKLLSDFNSQSKNLAKTLVDNELKDERLSKFLTDLANIPDLQTSGQEPTIEQLKQISVILGEYDSATIMQFGLLDKAQTAIDAFLSALQVPATPAGVALVTPLGGAGLEAGQVEAARDVLRAAVEAVKIDGALALGDSAQALLKKLRDGLVADPAIDVATFRDEEWIPARSRLDEAVGATRTALAIIRPNLPQIANLSGDLLPQLQSVLSGLRREQRLAQAGSYPRVQPWLDELIGELEGFASEIQVKIMPSSAPTSSGGPAANNSNGDGSEELSHLPDLERLTAPPALHPANAARLVRKLPGKGGSDRSNTTAIADLAPQLAVAFDANLAGPLYDALANSKTQRSTRFQGLSVLRAKASPFGYNAQPRTLPLRDGGVANLGDWPLAEDRVTLRLLRISQNPFSMPVEVDIAASDQTRYTHRFGTAEKGKVTLGKEKEVTLFLDRKGDLVVSLTVAGKVNRRITVEYKPTQNPPTFDVIDERPDLNPKSMLEFETQDGAEAAKSDDFGYLIVSCNDQKKNVIAIVSDRGTEVLKKNLNVLRLDTAYDKVTRGSYVVVLRANPRASSKLDNPLVARVEAVATIAGKDFGMSGGKITQVTLDRPWLEEADTKLADIRDTSIFLQSEVLDLAGEPYDADVGRFIDGADGDAAAGRIELDAVYDGLPAGRWIVVAGERTDVSGTTGVKAAELAMLLGTSQLVDKVYGAGQGWPHTLLQLASPLSYSYQRATVTLYGNVVKATQGETKNEILGAGDATRPAQRFILRQSPLTHLSAPTPLGAVDTLQVRVNGVLWHEKGHYTDLGPNDAGYVIQTDDAGTVSVIFGDGVNGSRLPTGTDNIRANYRAGMGLSGNLAGGKITQLLSRPLGVRDVVNPIPAMGGADRESIGEARRNAPVGISALDRLVSVSDYADFARAYAGIVKVYAARLPDGSTQRLHLTVAGKDGAEIPEESELAQNLLLSLQRFGDPSLPLTVAARRSRLLIVVARIFVNSDYQFETVVKAVADRMFDAFGFANREFGQDVLLSDVIAVMQGVVGVEAVAIDNFGLIDEKQPDGKLTPLKDIIKKILKIGAAPAPERLDVRLSRFDGATIQPAEIACLPSGNQNTLILNEWKP